MKKNLLIILLFAPFALLAQVRVDPIDTIGAPKLQNPCPPGMVHVGDSLWITDNEVKTKTRERVWWPTCEPDGTVKWRIDVDDITLNIPVESRIIVCKDTSSLQRKDDDIPDEIDRNPTPPTLNVIMLGINVNVQTDNGKKKLVKVWWTNRFYPFVRGEIHRPISEELQLMGGIGLRSTSHRAVKKSADSDWITRERFYGGVELMLAGIKPIPTSSCDTCWVWDKISRNLHLLGEIYTGINLLNPESAVDLVLQGTYRFMAYDLSNASHFQSQTSWFGENKLTVGLGIGINVPNKSEGVFRGMRFEIEPNYDLFHKKGGGKISAQVLLGKERVHPVPVQVHNPHLVAQFRDPVQDSIATARRDSIRSVRAAEHAIQDSIASAQADSIRTIKDSLFIADTDSIITASWNDSLTVMIDSMSAADSTILEKKRFLGVKLPIIFPSKARKEKLLKQDLLEAAKQVNMALQSYQNNRSNESANTFRAAFEDYQKAENRYQKWRTRQVTKQ